jgi:hypothetical protein
MPFEDDLDVLDFTCDWVNCPTHYIRNAKGTEFITVITSAGILHFYAMDCLAFWAGSFPVGHLVTGTDATLED